MLAGLLVDHGTVPTNFQGLTTVTLLGRHELDAAVAVLELYQATNAATH